MRHFAIGSIIVLAVAMSGGLATAQTSAPTLDATTASLPLGPDFSDFVGGWWYHGFYLTVQPDGTASAAWRTYRWCADLGPPCDHIEANGIINGGIGEILFDSVETPAVARDWAPGGFGMGTIYHSDLPIARGRVLSSSDESRLIPGSIFMALLPYLTAALGQSDDGRIICKRTDAYNGRPGEVSPEIAVAQKYRACGA